MAQLIKEIMTAQIYTVPTTATIREVARVMQSEDIGDVLVVDDNGALCGIATDRDLVVRGVAVLGDIDEAMARDVCTDVVVKLPASATIDEAILAMRENAVRRIPVVNDDGAPIGIVTIGDLARDRDPRSALAEISTALPNN